MPETKLAFSQRHQMFEKRRVIFQSFVVVCPSGVGPLCSQCLLQQRSNEFVHNLHMLVDLVAPKLQQGPKPAEPRALSG